LLENPLALAMGRCQCLERLLREAQNNIVNVKNGRVIEVTDSMDAWVPGDPIYYYGTICPEAVWSKIYSDPNSYISKMT
jgi:hypothetical protein